jgi:polyisoprenyl-phosphate glycosyltransferase
VNDKLISIIVPVFNEEQNVPEFFEAVLESTKNLGYNFELIFVDDGSKDKSVDVIHTLKTERKNVTVKLIQLSRNFGKEIASTAGLHASKGSAAILIDADLQHPAEKIPEFLNKWEDGGEVVIGVRKIHAHGSPFKHWGSELFYKLIGKISDTEIIPHATDFRLIDRQVIDHFNRFTERERITRGLIDWLGFKRDYVQFTANKRRFGKATYSTNKLIHLAINGFTTHSLVPLKLAGYLGVILCAVFGPLGVIVYIQHYWLDDRLRWDVTGTGMLAILMLFSIGVVLVCLGLVAMYVANIHSEVMNRPLYVVRKTKSKG